MTNWWLSHPRYGYGSANWFDLTTRNTGHLSGAAQPQWRRSPERSGGYGALKFGATAAEQVSCGFIAPLAGAVYWSLSAWMAKPTGSNVALAVFCGTSQREGISDFSDGNVYFLTGSGSSFGSASVSSLGLTAGEWKQWVMVFDGDNTGNARLAAYVNGRAINLSYSGTQPAAAVATATFLIGRDSTAGHVSNGVQDDVTLWDRALTPTEVAAWYQQSRRGYPDILNWDATPVGLVMEEFPALRATVLGWN